ncbi:hypothetical protein Q5H93_01715 [Hymenobacter sp. ASUV-10]|uniref:Right-handed parallel beta-helix repeat-containing protein n=1 Tax=Hymenobacter aranciens TaxID=3063996 RepID=A0ABT9B6K7_9BACT|nr:hypothetical protein [Hymenobacter sp. ASUV-10]MDO7873430.1 hypothetical protein [Hymenobacter sp. ASUV-10]
MRHFLALFILLSCLATFLPGCEPKEDLVQTAGSLTIEQDTVLFDTVFTTVGTVTKRLWVYNRNSGAVKTDVSLAGLAGGTYSLIINGDQATSASGVLIRGNDSMQVLVKAKLGPTGYTGAAKDFLVRDDLHFRTNGNDQLVRLIAYGQNAYFHRARIISGNVTWPTDKPHVIINKDTLIGNDLVPIGVYVLSGSTLNIPPGARIYCHAGATLQVDGTLLVGQGLNPPAGTEVPDSSASIVRFRGDRLEKFYDDIPGQWAGIIFSPNSSGNRISYTEIKNANFGVSILNYGPDADYTTPPDVTLENTTIRNISGSNPAYVSNNLPPGGIVSLSGRVTARNCLFTNCGEYAVLGVGQSAINLNFCTVANYTPSFNRKSSSLTFDGSKPDETGVILPLTVRVSNSIIWGSIEDELYWEGFADPRFNYTISINNSILRTKDYADNPSQFNNSGNTNQTNVADPKFKRTPLNAFNRFDYRLDTLSPASNRPRFGAVVATDLVNKTRDLTLPDLGAYERVNP